MESIKLKLKEIKAKRRANKASRKKSRAQKKLAKQAGSFNTGNRNAVGYNNIVNSSKK